MGETEDELYANLLQAQSVEHSLGSPKLAEVQQIEAMIDKDTKALLRACSMLRIPHEADIASKKMFLGEKHKLKTLVLDMDETMIHSKFYPITSEELKNGV
jgi:predicted secreted acid phosphatase